MSSGTKSWDSFAIVLIDVQKDFWTDDMSSPLTEFQENVARLLRLARSEGIDVVHLRAGFQPDKSDWMPTYKFGEHIPCVEGTAGVEFFDCAVPAPGEPIITKQTFDGFQNPELEAYLSQHNKKFLIVAGLVTSVCVLLTAATAAQRGYLTALVEDCSADKRKAHEHTLQRYPFVFDRVLVDDIETRQSVWNESLEKLAGL